jgi:DNA end-binding protein Ku
VPAASIDRLYWDTPYYLAPSGKTGIEAFAVIRTAMMQKDMVAIGRLVMSTRERICALEPHGDGLVLTTLRTAEEVRAEDEIVHPDLPKPDPRMLDIAEKIVDQQTGTFDPSHFTDRYEEALRALIEEKKKGKPAVPSRAKSPSEGTVVDLMEALRRSLAGKGGAPKERATKFLEATTSKKKPARKPRKAA